jgi:hypothetical protein
MTFLSAEAKPPLLRCRLLSPTPTSSTRRNRKSGSYAPALKKTLHHYGNKPNTATVVPVPK